MVGTLTPLPGGQVEIGISIDFEQMHGWSREQIEALMHGVAKVLIAEGRHQDDADVVQIVENARIAGL